MNNIRNLYRGARLIITGSYTFVGSLPAMKDHASSCKGVTAVMLREFSGRHRGHGGQEEGQGIQGRGVWVGVNSLVMKLSTTRSTHTDRHDEGFLDRSIYRAGATRCRAVLHF